MKDTILKQKVYHNGVSMVVLGKGDKHKVPDDLRQSFIDEGVIEGKTSDELAREEAARAASGGDEQDDVPLFTAKHIAGGVFAITGPGLDEPEKVKGKTEVAVRIAELEADYAKSQDENGGAPTE
jgi:hypothetical protein